MTLLVCASLVALISSLVLARQLERDPASSADFWKRRNRGWRGPSARLAVNEPRDVDSVSVTIPFHRAGTCTSLDGNCLPSIQARRPARTPHPLHDLEANGRARRGFSADD
jgi:hypothetical protein